MSGKETWIVVDKEKIDNLIEKIDQLIQALKPLTELLRRLEEEKGPE